MSDRSDSPGKRAWQRQVVVDCVHQDWRGSPGALIKHQRQYHGTPALAECSVTALQSRVDQISDEMWHAEDRADLTLEREMLLLEISRRDSLDPVAAVRTQEAMDRVHRPPRSGRSRIT